jgi:hypothetical protein
MTVLFTLLGSCFSVRVHVPFKFVVCTNLNTNGEPRTEKSER